MTNAEMRLIERHILDWHDEKPYFPWAEGEPLRIDWAFEVVEALRQKGWLLKLTLNADSYSVRWLAEFTGGKLFRITVAFQGWTPQDAIFIAAAKVAKRIAEQQEVKP